MGSRKMVPPSGPESLRGRGRVANPPRVEGRVEGTPGSRAGLARSPDRTPLPCAHPASAQGQRSLAPSSPQAEPAPSQCPGSRVPQLLLGFSVEPRWGLMGDCQAPLNRILIIHLQQEFSPPGLGPSQIPPSPPQHLPSPRSRLSQLPPPLPACPSPHHRPDTHTHCGGLWPISWGPRRKAWHLPPTTTGRTAPALGERLLWGAPLRSASGAVRGQT